MKFPLDQQLAALPKMSRKTIQALWADLFGKVPSPSLRREVLVPILAYRLQEVTFGGLKPASEKRLRALAQNGSVHGHEAPGHPAQARNSLRP